MTPTDQFHRRLLDLADGKARLELDAVRKAFQQVHPELATAPSARGKLRQLLDTLQLDERLELPKGKKLWDTSALPSLPCWVQLPRESVSAEKPDLRAIPWCPELRFLATTRVFVPLADLLQLQEFFARGGRERPLVPIKERSLDIFGDEKRLDQLARSSALFGDGRLTPETLRCFIVPEPLPWTAGPDASGPLLVIENAATWHSYCRWNAERKLFSAVVYGCGNRFMDSATYLGEIFKSLGGPRRVLYFGDLDPQGLLIPQAASDRTRAGGLPPVEPHLWSYRQLLKFGAAAANQPLTCELAPRSAAQHFDSLAPSGGEGQGEGASSPNQVREKSCAQSYDGEAPPATLCDWLGDCAEPTRQLFATNQRLAQEHLGWEFLRDKAGTE